jgi:hypothetical protein
MLSSYNKDKTSEKSTNQIKGNNEKPKSKMCLFCKKEHNFKECIEKFRYYSYAEANLLTKIDAPPHKRDQHPREEDRLTENTPWIKKRLERSADKEKSAEQETKKV